MFKKLIFVGGGIALLLALLFGGSALSYVYTGVQNLQEKVDENISLDWKLDTAERQISNLDGVVKDLMRDIAKEEVEIEHLKREIGGNETDLASNKDRIMRLKNALDSGESTYQFTSTGPTYTASQVKKELTRKFESYKTRADMVEAMKNRLNSRNQWLVKTNEQLRETISQKQQLQDEVDNLRAKLKMIEVAKVTNRTVRDNSQLSKTRELIDKIKSQVEVEAKLVNAHQEPISEIVLDEPVDRNISEEIAEYFIPGDSNYVSSSDE